jgi:hypothetical protein
MWSSFLRSPLQNPVYTYLVSHAFHLPSSSHSQVHFPQLALYQQTSPSLRPCEMFRNMLGFYFEVLLALRPTPKLKDHLSSAVRYCLSSVFAARSNFRNLRTRHAVVTGTHLSTQLRNCLILYYVNGQLRLPFCSHALCSNKTEISV